MEAEEVGLWCLHITGKKTKAQRDVFVTGETDPESKASARDGHSPGAPLGEVGQTQHPLVQVVHGQLTGRQEQLT